MCGIVGYTGRNNSAKTVYKGLEQLEYRGYDSAGIAVLSEGAINIVKRSGKVKKIAEYVRDLHGNTAIGHTRWATHGKPSDENAHPHTSGKFALVHNGIIENFSELKEKYLPDEKFLSQTDSEVIVKLIDKFYKGDTLATLKFVADMLTGSYALALINSDFDGIFVAVNKSPAVIGFAQDGHFVASDIPALGECESYIVLKDGDYAMLTADGAHVFNSKLEVCEREKIINRAHQKSLSLGNYPHYMIKEMYEQPATVKNTVSAFYKISDKLKGISEGINRVIYTGCGTAYHSGLLGKRYTELLARIPSVCETAGEMRYSRPIIDKNTLVVAISQSGETADTLETAKLAKSLGGRIIAVTNSPYSALTRVADAVVPVEAGAEICVASTKSYSGQVVALYLLACTIAGKIGKPDDIAGSIEKVLHMDISSVADMCARADGVFFLGRDIDYASALEGSLKLKEVSYIHSEGYPSGELKHGTLALMDIRKVAVSVITNPALSKKSENAVEQVLSRNGKAVIITNVESTAKKFEGQLPVFGIPHCDPLLSPLLTVPLLQKIAYETALLAGRDPDKPRNLAKSVTVE